MSAHDIFIYMETKKYMLLHVTRVFLIFFAGEKQYSFEEFLAIFKQTEKVKEWGTFRDFEEAFKSFDREGQGYISAAEARHLLTAMGLLDIDLLLFQLI